MHRTIRFALPGLVALAVAACSSTNSTGPSTLTTSAGSDDAVVRSASAVGGTLRGTPQQVEGRIEGFPATPAASFVLAGMLVETDANTTFAHGSTPATFADLAIGQRVKAIGAFTSTGLWASVVRIQNTNGDLPGRGNVLKPIPLPAPPPPPPPAPPPPSPQPLPAFDPQPILGLVSCQGFTCGFAFSPRQDISVVALGHWDQGADGLSTHGPVRLWDGNGQLLAAVSVPAGSAAPLVGEYRYVAITPVPLLAGQVYVIGNAFTGGPAPSFDPARMDAALSAIQGRIIFADAYPSNPHASFFGGANFQFVPAGP